jgi:hypothetical protein
LGELVRWVHRATEKGSWQGGDRRLVHPDSRQRLEAADEVYATVAMLCDWPDA